jgi:hypothetical protein
LLLQSAVALRLGLEHGLPQDSVAAVATLLTRRVAEQLGDAVIKRPFFELPVLVQVCAAARRPAFAPSRPSSLRPRRAPMPGAEIG